MSATLLEILKQQRILITSLNINIHFIIDLKERVNKVNYNKIDSRINYCA